MLGRPSLGGRSAASATGSALLRGKREVPAHAGQFSFPILTVEEILVCLNELNIHVDEDDLVKARPEAVRNVYEQLIYESLGMAKEELYTPQYALTDAIKFEELHEDSIPVLHFIRAMNKLLVASGVTEGFSLRELVKPDPARVRRNLSGIINFQKYKEERITVYAAHTSKTVRAIQACSRFNKHTMSWHMQEELLRIKAELQQRNEELQRQLREERALRAAEMPAIDALRGELAALTTQRDELDSAITRTKGITVEQKDTILALKDAITAADSKIESVREDIEARRGQVIASPARLKAEVEHVARLMEEARASVSTAESESRGLRRQAEVVAKADQTLRKALTLMTELEGEIAKLKRVARDVKTRQADSENLKRDVASLESQAEHLTRGIKRAEDRLHDIRDTNSAKEDALERATSTARHELQVIQEEIIRARDARHAAEQRKAEIEAEKERALTRHNAEMADMMAGIKHLQKLVTDYHARLFRGVAEAGGSSGL